MAIYATSKSLLHDLLTATPTHCNAPKAINLSIFMRAKNQETPRYFSLDAAVCCSDIMFFVGRVKDNGNMLHAVFV